MTIPTTAVTCRAYSQDGEPIQGATFAFKLNRLETYNGFVVPQMVTVTTDDGGVAVAELFPNALGVVGSQYTVRGRDAVGRRFLDSYATVPDADCELDDVLMLAAYGVTLADSALPATSPPLQSSGTVGTVGASTKYAREDHIHPLPPGSSPSSTTPAENGTASPGTENSFSRGDHVHPTDTSRAAQTALAALSETVNTKAPLESPALTGNPTAPTQAGGNSSTRLATTEFVAGAVSPLAPLANPAFTGVPTAPTADGGTATTQLATTAFVAAATSQAALTNTVAVAGASHSLVTANATAMIRFTGTGAKTMTVSGASGYAAGQIYNVTNRAASGDLTLTASDGMTMNPPKGGTLVLEPGDTVSLHCISSTVMDVLGSTKSA